MGELTKEQLIEIAEQGALATVRCSERTLAAQLLRTMGELEEARAALLKIAVFGKANPGFGLSCSQMALAALAAKEPDHAHDGR